MADAANPGHSLPSRSSYRCNQKKIRCSKTQPCDSCVRSRSVCTFPGPGRAPRRRKGALKAELIARVRNFEQELRHSDSGSKELVSKGAPVRGNAVHELERVEDLSDTEHTPRGFSEEGPSNQYLVHVDEELLTQDYYQKIEEPQSLTESPQEISGLKLNLHSIHDTLQRGDQFLFGFSSQALSLEAFHPSVPQCQKLWNIYQENVAPVLMIFHKPTLLKLIYKSAANTSSLDHASEAIAFAVYFAAVNSMSEKQCSETMSHDHSSLREYYKFATRQALARAGFLRSRSLEVLQASVLFLTCLRSREDADFVLTMVAAIHRMAQAMGLNREKTFGGLSPFEIEMRRRLWWHVYLLDSQSSELHSINTQIIEGEFDTEKPLNIDDSDISSDSTEIPHSRVGFTGMTFCLLRIEMIVHYRRSALVGYRKIDNSDTRRNPDFIDKRLQELEELHCYLQDHYLRFCDLSIPIQWVTATIIRLALARLWLTANFSNEPATDLVLSIEVVQKDLDRDQLFATALEVVEFAHLLETDSQTMKWSWFFEGYPQWLAAAIVLLELCSRQRTAETDRAWHVVQTAVENWIRRNFQVCGITMQAVVSLMEQVAKARGSVWNPLENT
ncbi:uncharacterized protein N7483_009388 [Penicillium malachiteum]|uniref:uncharacterized protein n=1 Tax=Penicillium malachiteum TaxID=1324776 RepID=UPI0025493723|nr:uncharacterized protein N7483_009388 [Penicillium malachiteum]KAJ5721454.1 hypothetical protein N7483_009388 [Penicillium malachiteum]